MSEELSRLVARHTRDVADFPSPGVMFKDLTPLFTDAQAFRAVTAGIAMRYRGKVDAVAGVEARGFILGAPLALELDVAFIPIRKKGKLPGDVESVSYSLEYGSATIEVLKGAVRDGSRVLVVDDVLATGGTAVAACQLVEKCGGQVAGVDILVEIEFLKGREPLGQWPVASTLVV